MQNHKPGDGLAFFTNVVSGLKALFHPGSVQKFIENLQTTDESVNTLNSEGDSILHSIVKRQFKHHRQKQEYLTALLMYSDVDVNLLNAQKTAALHIAVDTGDMQSVRTLLVFGADINILDGNKKTPLDLVVGPYRFLTRQESGFTVVDSIDGDETVPTSPAVSPVAGHGNRRPLLKSQPSITDDEVVAPKLKTSSFSAVTAFTSMFARSNSIDQMADLLVEYGGERGRKMPQRSRWDTIRQARKCIVQQFQDVVAMEPKESMLTTSRMHKLNCPKDDWTSKIASMNYEILSNIERKLQDVQYRLSQHPDEAMALGIQMKELKMLREAGSRILFLDGGGMKGLIQIEILSQLEEQTGRRITELFDWIVGTSTGGIVALALVHGKKTLRELRQLYFRLKDDVFGKGRFGMAYNTNKLEEILKHEFGDMKMSDVNYPRVIVTAVNKSTINLKLDFFNNCFGDDFSTQPIWKVARYTVGGPIYFSALDDYVDGGVLANNPSAGGLTKIQDFYRSKRQTLPISVVVSIGSGKLPDQELGSVDAHEFLYFGKHWFDFKEHLSGRTKNLTTLLGNAVGESENIARNVASRCREQGVDYYRFSPQLTKVISAGETDLDTLYEMVLLAKKSISPSAKGSKDSLEFKRLIWKFHCCSTANQKMRVRLLQKTVSAPP